MLHPLFIIDPFPFEQFFCILRLLRMLVSSRCIGRIAVSSEYRKKVSTVPVLLLSKGYDFSVKYNSDVCFFNWVYYIIPKTTLFIHNDYYSALKWNWSLVCDEAFLNPSNVVYSFSHKICFKLLNRKYNFDLYAIFLYQTCTNLDWQIH